MYYLRLVSKFTQCFIINIVPNVIIKLHYIFEKREMSFLINFLFLIFCLNICHSALTGPYLRSPPPLFHSSLTITQADKELDHFLRQNYKQLINSTLMINKKIDSNYLLIYKLLNNRSLFVFDLDYTIQTKTLKINGVL